MAVKEVLRSLDQADQGDQADQANTVAVSSVSSEVLAVSNFLHVNGMKYHEII